MGNTSRAHTGTSLTLSSPRPPPRFVCKNNGVLFENQLLQIGVKSEFRQNLGVSGGTVGVGFQGDFGLGVK